MNRKLLVVLMTILVISGLVVPALFAQGGLDLDRYCRERGYVKVLNVDNTVYGWKCEDASGGRVSVSIQDACNQQHPGTQAQFTDVNSQHSWVCVFVQVPTPENTPVRATEAPLVNPPTPTPPRATPTSVFAEPQVAATSIPSVSTPSVNSSDPGPAFGNEETENRSGECTIESFVLDPVGPYVFGQEVQVRIESNCSTVRFSVNSDIPEELGVPDHSYTFRTALWGTGRFEICGEGRTSGSWSNSALRCFAVYVGPQWRIDGYEEPASEPNDGDADSGGQSCNSLSNLYVGAIAIVSDATPDPLNVRHGPSSSDGVKFTVPVRELVSVIAGPVCDGNLVWWEIGTNGNSGWAAEINGYNNRNLLLNGEPLPGGGDTGGGSPPPMFPTATPAGQPVSPPQGGGSCLPGRLAIGQTGRSIIDGRGSSAVRNTVGGSVIGSLNEGDTFTVIEYGPCEQAASGNWNRWIRIENSAVSGWVLESVNQQYVLEAFQEELQPEQPGSNVLNFPVVLVDGSVFTFEVDWDRAWILNGSEFVISELQKLQTDSVLGVVLYLAPVGGSTDQNKNRIEDAICGTHQSCRSRLVYIVNGWTMDTSGVGNVLYGYYEGAIGLPDLTDGWADTTQVGRQLLELMGDVVSIRDLESLIRAFQLNAANSDNPDDVRQREIGMELYRRGVSVETLNEVADLLELF